MLDAPPPADLRAFATLLKTHYAWEERHRRAITKEEIERAVRIALPLYQVLNGVTPFPMPMEESDRKEYLRLLKAHGPEFDNLEIQRPGRHNNSRLDQDSALIWLYTNLSPDFSSGAPDDLRRRINWYEDTHKYGRRLDAYRLVALALSAVEFMVARPPDNKPADYYAERVTRISVLIDQLSRWPILGLRHDHGKTLCAFAA